VGICDDVTHTSLPVGAWPPAAHAEKNLEAGAVTPPATAKAAGDGSDPAGLSATEAVGAGAAPAAPSDPNASLYQAVFYGFGSDGTVGATKAAATVVGEVTGAYVQDYSWFDSKKSGGLTICYQRFGARPIHSPYLITAANYVACHKDIYVTRGYRLSERLAAGGTFVLACAWAPGAELAAHLPAALKRDLAAKGARLYVIDAAGLAAKHELGHHINMIMTAVFLRLAHLGDFDTLMAALKREVQALYASKGADVVANNLAALDDAVASLVKVPIPAEWATVEDDPSLTATGDAEKCLEGAAAPGACGAASANAHVASSENEGAGQNTAGASGACDTSNSANVQVAPGENPAQGSGSTPGAPAAAPQLLSLETPALTSDYLTHVFTPMEQLEGDLLPVSAMHPAGLAPVGTTALEKRTVAEQIPIWNPDQCIQCFECSLVCPHAAIRPFLPTPAELKGTNVQVAPSENAAAASGATPAPLSAGAAGAVAAATGAAPAASAAAASAGAPATFTTVPSKLPAAKAQGRELRIQVFPRDCVGCGSCAHNCPGHALTMTPLSTELAREDANLAFAQTLAPLGDLAAPTNAVTSQLQEPLLQFGANCAGCGETPYVKLLTQLFGDRLIIANATGCSSIWGAYAPSTPYAANCRGNGVAWGNSLFEDNGEYAYGIAKGVRVRRAALERAVAAALEDAATPAALAALLREWQTVVDDADKSFDVAGRIKAELAREGLLAGDGSVASSNACTRPASGNAGNAGTSTGTSANETSIASATAPAPTADAAAAPQPQVLLGSTVSSQNTPSHLEELAANASLFAKKSIWAVGGDGWAYDIDYGGLDEVLASKENINVLVLDTEGYSNTGGEMSKATQLGSVSGFSASGKPTPKKALARMAMQYGYVYVAQVALGANMQQVVRALREAEAYNGPSLVVALCPCISWGLKAGMKTSIAAEKEAVACGYWDLWHFDPRLAATGKNPLVVDAPAPDVSRLPAFLAGQNRYASLAATQPARSQLLQSELAKDCQDDYTRLTRTQAVYQP
jgi:pyruvate-ferredoxin/flavodoxin oxidoreductase